MDDQVIDAPQGASEQVSAPEVQDQPSLRDTIAAAVAKQREPVTTDAPVKVEAPEVKPESGRDEKGRFAKTEEKEAEQKAPVEAKVGNADPLKVDGPAKDAVTLKPPTSWSPTAKVAFEKLPPEVQQAVAKREEEVNSGFAKFQEFKPIEPYIKMAKDSGTTLDKALENYVGIERELGRDMVSGVARICQNQGVHPVALANAILARHGASSQQDGGQQQAHQTVPSVDLTPIQNEITALKSFIEEQQQAGVQTEIQRFASDAKHVFFENVKADMGRLIESGHADTLEDAYDKACWANKEIRELLIKQQTAPTLSAKANDAVQRAKAADKATGGAPSAGFTPTAAVKPGASIRDTIRAAVEAQRGV